MFELVFGLAIGAVALAFGLCIGLFALLGGLFSALCRLAFLPFLLFVPLALVAAVVGFVVVPALTFSLALGGGLLLLVFGAPLALLALAVAGFVHLLRRRTPSASPA